MYQYYVTITQSPQETFFSACSLCTISKFTNINAIKGETQVELFRVADPAATIFWMDVNLRGLFI